jgi:hypothetical protein
VKPLVRAAALAAVGYGILAPPASADAIITPFAGKTFAAQHTLFTGSGLPVAASVDKQTWVLGGSAAWLSDNVLGAELDFGYAPRFFESNQGLLPAGGGNTVVSLTGNVLLAVPVAVTRESLRPYVSAGMGLLHAGVDDAASLNTDVQSNFTAISVGGGAIGFLSPRTGIRFDLRHVRTVTRGLNPATGENEPRLGFWRATIGVALRY